MGFLEWFKPRSSLPKPSLHLLVLATEETLPCPLQLVHPAGLWGAQVGVPAALRQHPRADILVEMPMDPGDYSFEAPQGTALARVEQRGAGDPEPGQDLLPDPGLPGSPGLVERNRVEHGRWRIALELASVVAAPADALLFLVKLADRLAELSAGVVLDREAARCYLPGGWRIRDALRPVDAREHVAIHSVPGDGGSVGIHTHGLSKFGRSELEIRHVARSLESPAWALLANLCQYVVEGAVLRPGETVGDPGAPLLVRPGREGPASHYTVPSLELVDVGAGGKPLERGATLGIAAFDRAGRESRMLRPGS